MVEAAQITGLILAGGQGSRLGGIDKGLQEFNGQPLAWLALQRLAPQVSRAMISANRNLQTYARMGAQVWPDEPSPNGYEGPLAGFLGGLRHCSTPYLVTVPCDCPHFPADLVLRLSRALTEADADLAVATTPLGPEPAFCLMKREVQVSLQCFMQTGQRKVERWTAGLRRAEAVFDDPTAFFNINTPDDLARA
ncbi:MAG TPA: molybdenum cofactor guanylyltransferase MobA [Rhizobacter sp.]|nr:molybdenum cofactor guanylyltransferase MobA [Rhizobacter sp.]